MRAFRSVVPFCQCTQLVNVMHISAYSWFVNTYFWHTENYKFVHGTKLEQNWNETACVCRYIAESHTKGVNTHTLCEHYIILFPIKLIKHKRKREYWHTYRSQFTVLFQFYLNEIFVDFLQRNISIVFLYIMCRTHW